jgi:hypothetical protein
MMVESMEFEKVERKVDTTVYLTAEMKVEMKVELMDNMTGRKKVE